METTETADDEAGSGRGRSPPPRRRRGCARQEEEEEEEKQKKPKRGRPSGVGGGGGGAEPSARPVKPAAAAADASPRGRLQQRTMAVLSRPSAPARRLPRGAVPVASSGAAGDVDDDDDDDPAALVAQSTTRRRRRRISRKPHTPGVVEKEVERADDCGRRLDGDGDRTEGDDDDDDDCALVDDAAAATTKAGSGKRKRASRATATATLHRRGENTTGRGGGGGVPKTKREGYHCPHCPKAFAVPYGLRYHVDHYVCRPAQRPGGPVVKGRRKKKAPVEAAVPDTKVDTEPHGQKDNTEDDTVHKSTTITITTPTATTKQYQRLRGAVADRTCPRCHRVFTSVSGRQYHLDKRVCENSRTSADRPFATLLAGQRFCTKYGVVEVVSDERAVPTAALDGDAKRRSKVYHSALTKRETQLRLQFGSVAVESRARRALLQLAYLSGAAVTPRTVAQAPRARVGFVHASAAGGRPHPPPVPADPSAPPGSFPDRIVECRWLPDQRPRVLRDEEDSPLEGLAEAPPGNVRLYLQRRLITNLYSKDTIRYHCPLCWHCFLSRPGLKYHVDSKACTKKAAKDAATARERLETIDRRAKLLAARLPARPAARAPAIAKSDPADGFRDGHGRFAGPRAVPVDEQPNQSGTTALGKGAAPPVPPASKTYRVVIPEPGDSGKALISPDQVLAELFTELYRAHGHLIGPMYPEVWIALGYVKPKKKTTKRKRKKKATNGTPNTKRSKPAAADPEVEAVPDDPGPPPVFTERTAPLPAIIDTRTLVQEVDAGRYPSIKRLDDGDGRDTACAICKAIEPPHPLLVGQQNLIPCGFCRQVVHFSCVCTRFILKDPEPDDDFMCHNCIGVISARRARAEKRRLEKLANPDVLPASNPNTATSTTTSAPSLSDGADLRDVIALTNGVVLNREFECVAAQGRRVEELVELLRDAATRLATSMDVAAVNQARRATIECADEDADSVSRGCMP